MVDNSNLTPEKVASKSFVDFCLLFYNSMEAWEAHNRTLYTIDATVGDWNALPVLTFRLEYIEDLIEFVDYNIDRIFLLWIES